MRGQTIGMMLYVGTMLALGLFFWLIFFMSSNLMAQIFVFVTLASLLSIVAWIGYDMATTLPPGGADYDPTYCLTVGSQQTGSQQDQGVQ